MMLSLIKIFEFDFEQNAKHWFSLETPIGIGNKGGIHSPTCPARGQLGYNLIREI